jgi:hypothetical protein
MCYPYRQTLRLSPVAAQSLYASSHDNAYRWTTLSEELHPASLPTQHAFLGYRWSYSGSAIVRTCSRDWTMMRRTRTALATREPHASCRTIGVRLPQSLSVTSCPAFAGAGANRHAIGPEPLGHGPLSEACPKRGARWNGARRRSQRACIGAIWGNCFAYRYSLVPALVFRDLVLQRML